MAKFADITTGAVASSLLLCQAAGAGAAMLAGVYSGDMSNLSAIAENSGSTGLPNDAVVIGTQTNQNARSLQDIDNLMPSVPGQVGAAHVPTSADNNNSPIHFSTSFTYANSYWFRYRNRQPNRLNLENSSRLAVSLKQYGSIYLETFLDFAPSADKPYINNFAQRANSLGQQNYTGYAPENDLTEVDLTLGYHYDVVHVLGVDIGWANYITPVDQISVPAPVVGPARATILGHGQSDMQEAFIKLTLHDQNLLGRLANMPSLGDLSLNPYVYIGFDYSGSYDSHAGEYYQLGLGPNFTVPDTMGLVLNPFASVAFTSGQQLAAQYPAGTLDGYLGTTVGLNMSFPLNSLLHIPADYGTYTLGGFVDGIFARGRLVQPAGGSNTGVLTGVSLALAY